MCISPSMGAIVQTARNSRRVLRLVFRTTTLGEAEMTLPRMRHVDRRQLRRGHAA
jgi:hypothetical protein